jgi:hypothetical protein
MARFVLTDGVGRLSAAACGGGRRYLPLELLLRCEQGIHDTGRRCGWVKLLGCYGKGWPAANGRRGGAPRWAHRQDRRHELRPAWCWPTRGLYRQGAATGRPASMPRYGDHLDLRAHETGDGPLGARWRYGAARGPTRRLAFPGDRREGEPAARASRRWDLARTDAEAAERATRGVGTPGRAPARWRRSRARPGCFSSRSTLL